MDRVQVRKELIEILKQSKANRKPEPSKPGSVIDLSSSDSDSDDSTSSSDDDGGVLAITGKRPRVSSKNRRKKKKKKDFRAALPVGFLDPLPPKNAPLQLSAPPKPKSASAVKANASFETCKQFWKAGDYVGAICGDWDTSTAFAELLDNSLDEVCSGATFVNIDMLKNKKDGNRMLLIEDNGGGMDPDKMRQCMSLGYSAKSKEVDTIGQYGNGFKTSTMRLGADVIVFSRSFGQDGNRCSKPFGLQLTVKTVAPQSKHSMVPPPKSEPLPKTSHHGVSLPSMVIPSKSELPLYGELHNSKPSSGAPSPSSGQAALALHCPTGKHRDSHYLGTLTRQPTSAELIPLMPHLQNRVTLGTGQTPRQSLYPLKGESCLQLDYERRGPEWNKMMRSSASDWNRNVETMLQWSPFSSEADLLQQFDQMKDHGARIIIYNLWEDDQGQLELDFDADPYDIQIRGVNRDEKNIQRAKDFPNSKHYLTYRHSLRSYASILYLRIPPHFRIILRGKDVAHHNVVNDMMMTKEITYRPQPGTDGLPKDSNVFAVGTIGFVKEAKYHVDIQGFNVYHKNRLIKCSYGGGYGNSGNDGEMVVAAGGRGVGFGGGWVVVPFWRVWNAAGSGGRGVIGVLEANFVEPAHDKQGFERTIVLSRLETKLVQMQKQYWFVILSLRVGFSEFAHLLICYLLLHSGGHTLIKLAMRLPVVVRSTLMTKGRRESERYLRTVDKDHLNGHASTKGENGGKGQSSLEPSPPPEEDVSDNEMQTALRERGANGGSQKEDEVGGSEFSPSNSNVHCLDKLKEENRQLTERLERKEQEILGDLLRELKDEKDKCKLLETKLAEASQTIEDLNKEQENLIDIFAEERGRRAAEEANLRKKLMDASNTIQDLLDKVMLLEKMKPPSNK
ncbi:histidine kinase-, DNA gyrase B-, and HSP90-like ATPase family protein [Actinidia rufa]|uniref:Histidine kinase-, DNA gyrase B-, and HSP90-like ATPase family protein n=1 Tax=Actinidia rufa TaxID=165716 RepID=A0A7J0GB95_9ERIC|nr:histidine kinase-, DNA gyrase B-, and HSP90-like ATPase family protein [Actinidia rufa]